MNMDVLEHIMGKNGGSRIDPAASAGWLEKRVLRDHPHISKKNLSKILKRGWYKYDDYIKSEKWINRRERYWDNHERICYCCEEFAPSIHHITYKTLGREPDCDLRAVCNDCHEGIHRLVKSGKAQLEVAHSTWKQRFYK